METIKEIAATVSVSAVLIGSVYIICPSGQMSRPMKYVAGLIILLCIITPFMSASFNIERTEADINFSISAEQMLIKQTEYVALEVLREHGIEPKKIEVSMDIMDDGGISIYRIHLYGVSDSRAVGLLNDSINGCEVVIEDG